MEQIIINPSVVDWPRLLQRPAFDTEQLESSVERILKDIADEGDAALIRYTKQFDKAALDELRVSVTEIQDAEAEVAEELKVAIATAKQNIEKFHAAQQAAVEVIETMTGVQCWRKSVGIQKVGLYIPGGSAPLFSTLLMLGIPAKLAGCEKVVVCTPCDANGKVNATILYVAKLIGIDEVYKIGGVQAIGAMAYGTESVPKVFKIFGPGNQYVTCAKQLVNRKGVAIDMPAGPSEVAVYADETANAEFVAADLLSQAEHGVDSQVLLVASSVSVAEKVQAALTEQLQSLQRSEIATQAMQHSRFIVMEAVDVAFDLLNEYAAEHLIIASDNASELAEKVINAGSVFLGHYSPESVGDYASGTNHTLPTNGYATAYSGVSLDSFVKKITYQKLSSEGLQTIAPTVEAMAMAEGLDAHAKAVSIRRQAIETK